ncbi:MAG: DUF4832 domain-containing protein [Treponema sp.]|nr:DUF4832 domain-containing protein [Treponema sp.]
MKNFKLFVQILLIMFFTGCAHTVSTSTGSGLKVIYNPDMGFYSAKTVTVGLDGSITKSPSEATFLDAKGNYNKDAKFNLVHLKIDISAYQNTDDLKLDKIDNLLTKLEEYEQTTVIRFAYDKGYKGKCDGSEQSVFEPESFERILNHVEQICAVLKNHIKVITAVECGMLGPWGEMHTTSFAEKKTPKNDFITLLQKINPDASYYIASDETEIKKGYIVLLMEKFLTELKDVEVPFLVRQPAFIYHFLKRLYNHDFDGTNVPEHYIPQKGTKLYKLGMYNDGYLSKKSDEGTFKIHDGDNRNDEIAFLEAFTNHTPYGGELIGNYELSSSDTQLRNVHLSFLNIGWNADVLSSLDKTKAGYTSGDSIFKYILKHMGYRYKVKQDSSIIYENGKLTVELNLENIGFAELPYHRKKSVFVYLIPKGQEPQGNESAESTSAEFKAGVTKISFVKPVSLDQGEYDVYLKIADSDKKYPVQLDGKNVIWNENIRANKIGSIIYRK